MAIIIFGYLALASDQYAGSPTRCDLKDFLPKNELVPPVVKPLSYNLTLLDKETKLPVPNIYVKAHWTSRRCESVGGMCTDKCTLQFEPGDAADHFTDASGKIDGVTFPEIFKDSKDRVLIALDVEDYKGIYVSKHVSFLYDFQISSQSHTAYLIKKDAL